MKIVHIAGNYIDGWGYQENLIPLYQRCAGHDVVIISDNCHLKYCQNEKLTKEIIAKGTEYEYNGIKIHKIKTYLNTSSTSLFCRGLFKILEKEHPDIIFHHDVNFSTLPVAAKYKKRNPNIILYADNHADWINESKNLLWHKLFYETLIPWLVRRLGDVVNYYIGVSPLRCKYLKEMFGVPKRKIKFLPIGCDTFGADQVVESREDLRSRFEINNDAYVIVSGGKLDKSKGTLILIEACEHLRKKIANLHLLLFGKINNEVTQLASNKEWITLEDWCDRKKTLSLLKMADVACWPWLHTTLIEDSVAIGIPLCVKMSDNVSHFAKEQAGVFLEKGDIRELEGALLEVKKNSKYYFNNVKKARERYSYSAIVERLRFESFYDY